MSCLPSGVRRYRLASSATAQVSSMVMVLPLSLLVQNVFLGQFVKLTRYREKNKNEKPGDRIVSTVDKDARRGAKSSKKFFLGPKSEITLTGKSHLILNAKAIAGNEPDGGHIFEMVEEVKEIHGIEPPKIIGDGKYGSMDTRVEGRERGIQVVAPLGCILLHFEFNSFLSNVKSFNIFANNSFALTWPWLVSSLKHHYPHYSLHNCLLDFLSYL